MTLKDHVKLILKQQENVTARTVGPGCNHKAYILPTDYETISSLVEKAAELYAASKAKEEAIAFAEWIPMNAIVAEDEYYYLSLATNKIIYPSELYELFKKQS